MLEQNQILRNRYRIETRLGEGGMGIVYRAFDMECRCPVAIKETETEDTVLLSSFVHEAELLANLQHKFLPKVTSHFEENGSHYLVIEYIEGDDLREYLKKNNQGFPAELVLRWADQLLEVLTFLHEKGVLHRDLKPANLKVRNGDICLLDFGLAKGKIGAMQSMLEPSIFGYTTNFAPPEQMEGRPTTPQSDLYSLAATLYNLLTNIKPADSLRRAIVISQGMPDPLIPLQQLAPHLSEMVCSTIMQALSIKLEQRPANARIMRSYLSRNYAPLPIQTQPKQSPTTPNKNHTMITLAGVFAIFLLFLGFGAWVTSSPIAHNPEGKLPETAEQPANQASAGFYRKQAADLAKRAETLLQNSEYDDAIRVAKEAIAKDPENALSYAVLGDSNWDLTYDNKRRQNAEKILKILNNPQTSEDYVALSWAHLSFAEEYDSEGKESLAKNSADESVKYATKAIELKPDYSYAYMMRASAHSFVNENFGLAIDDFNKVLSLKPDYAQAYNNRAQVYLRKKNYEKAIEDYSSAIQSKPTFSRYYHRRGEAYKLNEQPQDALEDFNKAIEMYPKYSKALNSRARLFWENGDYQNAFDDYSAVINLNPKDNWQLAVAYNGRANVHYAQNTCFSTIIADYEKAVDLFPKDKDFSENLKKARELCE